MKANGIFKRKVDVTHKTDSDCKANADHSMNEEELLEAEDLPDDGESKEVKPKEGKAEKLGEKAKPPTLKGSYLTFVNLDIFIDVECLAEKTKRRSPVYNFFEVTDDPNRMICRSCAIKITVRYAAFCVFFVHILMFLVLGKIY